MELILGSGKDKKKTVFILACGQRLRIFTDQRGGLIHCVTIHKKKELSGRVGGNKVSGLINVLFSKDK